MDRPAKLLAGYRGGFCHGSWLDEDGGGGATKVTLSSTDNIIKPMIASTKNPTMFSRERLL
ncbi:MAG: hypothetical protein ACK56Q_20385, partial [Pirellulaceae bacterium]